MAAARPTVRVLATGLFCLISAQPANPLAWVLHVPWSLQISRRSPPSWPIGISSDQLLSSRPLPFPDAAPGDAEATMTSNPLTHGLLPCAPPEPCSRKR